MAHRSLRCVLAGRGFLLFPAAAYAVHQLRFELAYGSHAGQALSAQGHGYLDSLAPWVVLLVALALGSFLARVARAAAGSSHAVSGRPFAGLWLLTAASLVLTYVTQETLEGYFASGHPGGLAGVFGHGGWWALPLAGVAGLAVAALLRLAHAAVARAARRAASSFGRPAELSPLRPDSASPRQLGLLAGVSAGRAPPAAPCAALA